jgi:hypothetical protein
MSADVSPPCSGLKSSQIRNQQEASDFHLPPFECNQLPLYHSGSCFGFHVWRSVYCWSSQLSCKNDDVNSDVTSLVLVATDSGNGFSWVFRNRESTWYFIMKSGGKKTDRSQWYCNWSTSIQPKGLFRWREHISLYRDHWYRFCLGFSTSSSVLSLYFRLTVRNNFVLI